MSYPCPLSELSLFRFVFEYHTSPPLSFFPNCASPSLRTPNPNSGQTWLTVLWVRDWGKGLSFPRRWIRKPPFFFSFCERTFPSPVLSFFPNPLGRLSGFPLFTLTYQTFPIVFRTRATLFFPFVEISHAGSLTFSPLPRLSHECMSFPTLKRGCKISSLRIASHNRQTPFFFSPR